MPATNPKFARWTPDGGAMKYRVLIISEDSLQRLVQPKGRKLAELAVFSATFDSAGPSSTVTKSRLAAIGESSGFSGGSLTETIADLSVQIEDTLEQLAQP